MEVAATGRLVLGPAPSALRRARRFTGRYLVGGLCLVLLAGFVLMGVAAPLLAPHDPKAQSLVTRLRPHAWEARGSTAHLLGTDGLGRDELSRFIFGARISLIDVAVAVPASVVLGVAAGVLAAYGGGLVERIIMRLADAQLAFPAILLAVFLSSVNGPGLGNVLLVLVIFGWAGYARVVRASVLSVGRQEFVLAARLVGAGPRRIVLRHILPNILDVVVVLATLNIATVVLAEAGLSFIGVGVPFTTPSWGGMVSEGRTYVTIAWWLAAIPGLAIALVALSGNLLGDWLRDELDPRLRHTR